MNRLQSFSKRVLLNRLYSIQNASMKWSSSRKINPHDCNYDIKCRRINEHVLKSSISFYSTKSDHETKENFATGTTDSKTKELLTSLRKSVKEHGDRVRKLKEDKAPEAELKAAITELKACKKALEDKEVELTLDQVIFDRTKFDILLRRRFVFDQSYEIYGGASGLFDLGPIGCALKNNLIQLWRRSFVLEEKMLEIDCPTLTVENVFKASGHIERFTDYLVKDVVTDECFRFDLLIKAHLEGLYAKCQSNELKEEYMDVLAKFNGKTTAEMKEIMQKYNVKSPAGNDLTDPIPFNLMFSTQFGPANATKCYLRPETAQGIFVNFKRLLDYNNGRLPFSAAQVGTSFRNEIAPRSGLLRVREFTQAEIEHFFDPNDKSHPKFKNVENTKMLLYSACNQMSGEIASKITIGEAIKNGIISNESLGYFMAKIQQFMLRIGIFPDRLRFRQHMNIELAHYASDCWDCEILTSHGWLECVGCADRSAYDLTQHAKASGANLVAERKLDAPKVIEAEEMTVKDEFLKKMPSKKAKLTKKYLERLNHPQLDDLLQSLARQGSIELTLNDDTTARLDQSMVEVKKTKKTIHVDEFVPNVIEPSFGIGRILYAVLEHSFRKREEGDQNSYFAFSPLIAPQKCSILPLSAKTEFSPFVEQISSHLNSLNISHKIDDVSGSIGRRYVRCDEIGIPYDITIDFDTLSQPHTVTLRERDSKGQLRIPVNDVGDIIQSLTEDKVQWATLCEKYPKFDKQQSKE